MSIQHPRKELTCCARTDGLSSVRGRLKRLGTPAEFTPSSRSGLQFLSLCMEPAECALFVAGL